MNTHRGVTPCMVVLICLSLSGAFADDHIIQEHSRTYMGRTSPPQSAEAWIAADRTSVKDGFFLIITRRDLKKRWVINLRSKRYLEEALPAPEKSMAQEKKPFRIQEYGFDYEPVYDWTLDKGMPTETVEGKTCRKVVARGDADYAEETRESWVTQDVPINVRRAYETLTKPNLNASWLKIYEKTPELRKGFILKSIVTTENPIAPTMVWVTRVTKVEVAAPPAGIYDVPAGMQRVKTAEELYVR
jgi:hypothetical protein